MYFERNAVEEWRASVTEQAAMVEHGECVLLLGAGRRGERTLRVAGKALKRCLEVAYMHEWR